MKELPALGVINIDTHIQSHKLTVATTTNAEYNLNDSFLIVAKHRKLGANNTSSLTFKMRNDCILSPRLLAVHDREIWDRHAAKTELIVGGAELVATQ